MNGKPFFLMLSAKLVPYCIFLLTNGCFLIRGTLPPVDLLLHGWRFLIKCCTRFGSTYSSESVYEKVRSQPTVQEVEMF